MSHTVTLIASALAVLLALPLAGCTYVFGVSSHELVIVRLGREAGPDWDDTVIPNMLVRALKGEGA